MMIVYAVCDEEGVKRERVFRRNKVEHSTGTKEVVCFRVECDEFRSEEVVGGGRPENEAGLQLLTLAEQDAVCTTLDKAAVECEVNGVVIVSEEGLNGLAGGTVCGSGQFTCVIHSNDKCDSVK